ncbi:MAG TPA: hypothetical protein VH678_26940 [Xanthobacteraceae bacterium]|jgi:hypothetical protein
MMHAHPDGMIAHGHTAGASRRSMARTASFGLLGIAGAILLAVCTTAFLLWGINGPAYLLDFIAAYCG